MASDETSSPPTAVASASATSNAASSQTTIPSPIASATDAPTTPQKTVQSGDSLPPQSASRTVGTDEQLPATEDRFRAAAIVGGTGLVGSEILKILLNIDGFNDVTGFSRRAFPESPEQDDPFRRLRPKVHDPSSEWPSQMSEVSPLPATFFSALGTTRAQAGGFEKQKEIDYTLNLEFARAAKEAGVRFYVLISGGAANSKSRIGYTQMKGQLEDDVQKLDFERTVILRPGLLVGTRRESDSRPPEYALRKLAGFLDRVPAAKDFWAQDADVVAKAAVAASLECIGEARSQSSPDTPLERQTRILGAKDIIRLGRTEWDKKAT